MLTVSDGVSAGEREDASGDLLAGALEADGWELIAPSPIPWSDQDQVPREMTRDDMDRVKADFVRAVGWADEAGFDRRIRRGARPADLNVTQVGGNLVLTENGGTTTVGAGYSTYQDGGQSILTTYGSGPASGLGMSASGGPVEIVLGSAGATITS